MPRLKPPPQKTPEEMPEIEDNSLPTSPVEIELAGDAPQEIEIELKPKAPVKTEAPAADDNPLQKALDAQKHAEELQRSALAQRDEALRQARERDEELTRERGGREEAEYNSVLTAIAAEQASIDKAEADYAAAASAGEWALAAKVQRLLATASARLDRLEDGKASFDSKREAQKTEPPQQRTAPSAPPDFEAKINAWGAPETAKIWLRAHPELVNDNALTERLSSAHKYLTTNKNVQAFSAAYFDALDGEFGFKAEPKPPEPAQPQPRRSMPLSAPVSRDVPSASGARSAPNKMTLSPEEVQIARTSFTATDMSNAQKEYLYAQNKQKLQKMRANGEYRQTTEQTG